MFAARSPLLWICVFFAGTRRSASAFLPAAQQPAFATKADGRSSQRWQHHTLSATKSPEAVAQDMADALTPALEKDLFKTCKVKVAPVGDQRLGLVSTQAIKKGDVVLNTPYDDDRYELSPTLARNVVFKDILPADYDSWTGETGLVALLVLNELARLNEKGVDLPKRPAPLQTFVATWMQSLPTDLDHPLLWSEQDQEVLQMSSTKKIYRQLDDLEEDFAWLSKNALKDTTKFPATVTIDGVERPCFSVEGFQWAMACVLSRSFFVDGQVRLLPLFDFCNHNDDIKEEVKGGFMGTFGTTKGAQLVADRSYQAGDEVYCSYGPKSAIDYLLEHGFCPEECFRTSVAELSFEVDNEDRFRDDKLDILEFETYDLAPMDPTQTFDVMSAPGRDGEPDPAMMQFLRLCKLGSTDAFLLESIFRNEVWGFMELPVSEKNELDAVNAIIEACDAALADFAECPAEGPAICTRIREAESKALTRTKEFLLRDREALDLKEYYQERRLKDLGLDSEWSPEDDMSPDLGFGQTRVPGGADYDW